MINRRLIVYFFQNRQFFFLIQTLYFLTRSNFLNLNSSIQILKSIRKLKEFFLRPRLIYLQITKFDIDVFFVISFVFRSIFRFFRQCINFRMNFSCLINNDEIEINEEFCSTSLSTVQFFDCHKILQTFMIDKNFNRDNC